MSRFLQCWSACLLLAVLAACQTAANTPPPTVAPVITESPSPYPYPLPAVLPTPSSPYPIEEVIFEEITWEDAKALLLSGEVAEIFLFQNRTATLTLKDGRLATTQQPAVDEALKVIETCGEKCADIRVATE